MHFSISIVLGVGILSSLGGAIAAQPEGPESIADKLSYIKEHKGELDEHQIDALKNDLTVALAGEKNLAPEMRKRMLDAFGEEEAVNFLTTRKLAAECECRDSIWDFNCSDSERCVVGGCAIPGGGCDPQMNEPCVGLCFPK